MSVIANNPVAKRYSTIQKGYDAASNQGRLDILNSLKRLLLDNPLWTPIFDHQCYADGHRVCINASEQLKTVQRHIDRLVSP